MIASQNHFCVFGTIFGHNNSVKFVNFVVYKLVNVLMYDWGMGRAMVVVLVVLCL